jgi:hypothetical protein
MSAATVWAAGHIAARKTEMRRSENVAAIKRLLEQGATEQLLIGGKIECLKPRASFIVALFLIFQA